MFVLFNEKLNRFFKHPKYGVWSTDNKEEAEDLLETTKDYVIAIGKGELANELVILELNAN